jgi:hypothetical protein
VTRDISTRAALRLAWGVALLLGLLLMASGCGWVYTPGDRAMISGAREHLHRAGLKAEGAPALPGIVEADKNLAAMEERHGRSAVQWPEDDAGFFEANTEKRGAYKQTTAWWAALRAGLTGILGLIAGNPWTAGLGALFTAAVPLLVTLLRRKTEAEKAGLDAFDKLAEVTKATKEQKTLAGKPLAAAYIVHRKATP